MNKRTIVCSQVCFFKSLIDYKTYVFLKSNHLLSEKQAFLLKFLQKKVLQVPIAFLCYLKKDILFYKNIVFLFVQSKDCLLTVWLILKMRTLILTILKLFVFKFLKQSNCSFIISFYKFRSFWNCSFIKIVPISFTKI